MKHIIKRVTATLTIGLIAAGPAMAIDLPDKVLSTDSQRLSALADSASIELPGTSAPKGLFETLNAESDGQDNNPSYVNRYLADSSTARNFALPNSQQYKLGF